MNQVSAKAGTRLLERSPAVLQRHAGLWIPTLGGKAWFPYFRLYGPTEAHFDRTWILLDIEKVQ